MNKLERLAGVSGVTKMLNQHQEHLERLAGVSGVTKMLNQHQEHLERLAGVSGVTKMLNQHQEQLERLAGVSGVTKMLNQHQEHLERLAGVSGVTKMLNQHQEQLERLAGVSGVTKMLNQWAGLLGVPNPIIISEANIHKWIDTLEEQIEDSVTEDIQVNADGTITYLDEIYLNETIESDIDRYVNESDIFTESLPLEVRINNFLNSLSQQHPLIRKILIYFLLPIILGIFVNNITSSPQTINYNEVSVNQTVKILTKEYKIYIQNEDFFLQHRIVTKDNLKVYEGNSKHSHCIGTLEQYDIVKVIYKRKNWTLVEFVDENEQINRGWIFTRYLRKMQ